MKRIALILLAISCGFFSCKDDGVTPVSTSIAGKWELRKTEGGIANFVVLYAPGNGTTYQFNQNATYEHYFQGALQDKGPFTVQRNKPTIFGTKADMIYFNGATSGTVVKIAQDTLSLTDNYADGITAKYVKVGN